MPDGSFASFRKGRVIASRPSIRTSTAEPGIHAHHVIVMTCVKLCSCRVSKSPHQRLTCSLFDTGRTGLQIGGLVVAEPVHLPIHVASSRGVIVGGELSEDGMVASQATVLPREHALVRLRCFLGVDLENIDEVAAKLRQPGAAISASSSATVTYLDVVVTTFCTASVSRCDSRGSARALMFWSLKLPYWKLFGSRRIRETSS